MNKSIEVPFTFQTPYNNGRNLICTLEISGIATAEAIGAADTYDYELSEIIQVGLSGERSPNILPSFEFAFKFGLPEHLHDAIMGHVAYTIYPSFTPKHKAA